ncbi:MAG: hypothetical protein AAGD34_02045 [Pseudomonadota bacterium]
MNTIPQTLQPATPTAATIDVVRALPRRVIGFGTRIETGVPLEALRVSLEEMAEQSAFTLGSMIEEHAGAEGGGRFVAVEFHLKARRGTVGDPQIFALLREIAGRHRWNGMEKRVER